MFYFRFPTLGPEKGILIFASAAVLHSLVMLFLIFQFDFPAMSPSAFKFPPIFYGFRVFVITVTTLCVPAVLLPVGCAMGLYKAHVGLAIPFTVVNIVDLLIAFGYTLGYLPFLYVRVVGTPNMSVNLAAVAIPITVFGCKMLLQVASYSSIHHAIEEMAHCDDSSPLSLHSIHTVINILSCCAEKIYDLDLMALGLSKDVDEDTDHLLKSVKSGGKSLLFWC